MQKQNIAQLEMFSLDADRGESGCDPSRLKLIRGYQKIILKSIAFIFISLLAYSQGVETGKRQAANLAAGLNNRASAAEITRKPGDSGVTPVAAGVPVSASADIPVKQLQAEAVKLEQGKNNYTIQVASISNNKNVKSELASLKNKGYTAFSLVKGKYNVICVGKFEEKEDAKAKLQNLKTRYPDCQIRRL
ncbi:SPOR domain-containing protein [bacterium]|nr:MAG: SPOR domain-containing protein [bacterium]